MGPVPDAGPRPQPPASPTRRPQEDDHRRRVGDGPQRRRPAAPPRGSAGSGRPPGEPGRSPRRRRRRRGCCPARLRAEASGPRARRAARRTPSRDVEARGHQLRQAGGPAREGRALGEVHPVVGGERSSSAARALPAGAATTRSISPPSPCAATTAPMGTAVNKPASVSFVAFLHRAQRRLQMTQFQRLSANYQFRRPFSRNQLTARPSRRRSRPPPTASG